MPRAFLVQCKKRKRVQVLYHEESTEVEVDVVDGIPPTKEDLLNSRVDSPVDEIQDGDDREDQEHSETEEPPAKRPGTQRDLGPSENSAFVQINKQSAPMPGIGIQPGRPVPYPSFFPMYPMPYLDYSKLAHNFHKSQGQFPFMPQFVDPRIAMSAYYHSLAKFTEGPIKLPTTPLNRSLAENETLKRQDSVDGVEPVSPGSPARTPPSRPSAAQGSPRTPPNPFSVASLLSPTHPALPSHANGLPYAAATMPRYNPVVIPSATPMEPCFSGQPRVPATTPPSGHPAYQNYMPGRGRPNPDKPAPIKKYKCDVCGKAFSRSNTLVTHKRIHTGDKPFKCETCGRAFRQPGNLTRHRLTHTTAKPYVCTTCHKAFNRASNLHTHMRTHANHKPYVCQHCGLGFHQKMDLKIHAYNHAS